MQFSILYKDDDDPLAGLLSDDDDFDDVDPKPAAPKLKVLPQRASNAPPSDQSQGTWVINHKAPVNIKRSVTGYSCTSENFCLST